MPQYRDAGVLAKCLIGFFGAMIVSNLISIGLSVMDLGVLTKMEQGIDPDEDSMVFMELAYGVNGLAYLGIFVVIVVLFCIFVHRANKNARALGVTNLRFTPGWTVGYFFIPIMNLFRPYQAVTEIVKASDPEVSYTSEHGWKQSSSAITGWWWAAWLISGGLSRLDVRYYMRAETIDELKISSLITIVSESTSIIAAILAVLVVMTIHGRQRRKAAQWLPAHSGPMPTTQWLPGDPYPAQDWQR